MAALLELAMGNLALAGKHVRMAAHMHGDLGVLFRTCGIKPDFNIHLEDGVVIPVMPSDAGCVIIQARIWERNNQHRKALSALYGALTHGCRDLGVLVFCLQLALSSRPADRAVCSEILTFTGNLDAKSYVHATALAYRAQALFDLGQVLDSAKLLTRTLMRQRGHPPPVVGLVRYERARAFVFLGDWEMARQDLEFICRFDPGFRDAAERLRSLM